MSESESGCVDCGIPVGETEGAALSICKLADLALSEKDPARILPLVDAMGELAWMIALSERREAEKTAEGAAALPLGPRAV